MMTVDVIEMINVDALIVPVVVHENRSSPKKSVSVPHRRRHLSANEREEQVGPPTLAENHLVD